MKHFDVIISIKHEYATKIYDGTKLFELRKHTPLILPGTRCWIYEPMPIGKITGYFYYRGCMMQAVDRFWASYKNESGIDYYHYTQYFLGHKDVHAWMVGASHRIPPTDLSAWGVAKAPQSYMKLVWKEVEL